MSRTKTSIDPDHADLVQQAADCLGTVEKLLVDGDHHTDFGSPALPTSLAAARGRLAEALTGGQLAETDIGDACRVLVDIERVQEQLARTQAIRRIAELGEVHDAAVTLRGLSPQQIIEAAPEVVCTQLPFARSMISAVSGSLWQPRRLYLQPNLDGSPLDFSDYVDSSVWSLADAPLETELVRRRVPALVAAPAADDRTHKEIISRSRTSAYVAAPVMSAGKVIGLLHADRPGRKVVSIRMTEIGWTPSRLFWPSCTSRRC